MSWTRSLFVAAGAALIAAAVPVHAQTTINLTAIDGYPPKSLWVKEFIEFYIPEVDKRLARENKYKIRWNQARGGQIVKPNGVLEGLQKGLGDIGIVTTAIYGDKMNILSVAYATPFVTTDPKLVSHTIDAMVEKFPAIRKTFASYNQVYLTNAVVLDSYQVFTKPAVKGLGDLKGLKIAGAGLNLRYLGPLGAVGVSAPLVNYYNQIRTGVVEGCLLWPETVDYFTRHLYAEKSAEALAKDTGLPVAGAHAALRRHLGVVYDICHQAVEFEDISASLASLVSAGIPIFKLQEAAALRVPVVTQALVDALTPFADTVYLTQTLEKRDGRMTRYLNLEDAFAAWKTDPGAREWRTHFHVPVFLDDLGMFKTTRFAIEEALRFHKATPVSRHLEIETYTWDVLPQHLKTGDITDYVVRELEWVRGQLA